MWAATEPKRTRVRYLVHVLAHGLTAAVLLGTVLVLSPRMEKVLKDFDILLPLLTQATLDLCQLLARAWVVVAIICLGDLTIASMLYFTPSIPYGVVKLYSATSFLTAVGVALLVAIVLAWPLLGASGKLGA